MKKLFLLSFLIGCNQGKVILDQYDVPFDARLINQVFVWECLDGGESVWGTFGHEVHLYHAPDALNDLLPEVGCSVGVDMFPISAGPKGESFDGFSSFPQWSNHSTAGELLGGYGYWSQDVLSSELTCDNPDAILADVVTLDAAQVYTGASTVEGTSIPLVTFSGFDGTISWGDPVVISWEEHSWDRVWLQIRRTQDGQLYETVTCNVSGESEFEISQIIWNLMNENAPNITNNLYLGFENRQLQQVAPGNVIETLTRAISVALVNE